MKTKNIFSLAALAVALAACSSESDMASAESPSQKGKIVTLTATISANNASTRTLTDNGDGTISAAWEVGAEMEVHYFTTTSENRVRGKAIITNVDADGNATITAELTDPKNDTSVDFQYPYGYDGGQLRNDQKGTLDLINQKFDSQGGGGRLTVNGDKAYLPNNVHIEHHNCILKLNFLFDSQDIISQIRDIDFDIDLEGENQQNQQDHYHLGNLSLQDGDALYLALAPKIDYSTNPYTIKPTIIHIHAHAADGTTYHRTKQHIQLDKGKMYTASLEMEKEIHFKAWNENNNSWSNIAVSGYKVLNDIVAGQEVVELQSGWYVLEGELNYNGTIKFTEDAHLILSDNSSLSMNGSGNIDASGHELNIYAQRIYGESGIELGKINIYCDNETALQAGNLNVHGGIIEASTYADNNSGIIADNINVYGGIFGTNSSSANGNTIGIKFNNQFNVYDASHISGGGDLGGIQGNGPSSSMTVLGGKLDAFGLNGTGISCHQFTINGGDVFTSAGSGRDGMNCGIINVNGGELYARGGYAPNGTGGYGIGGGTIYVTGGELHASGGDGLTGETPTPGKAILETLEPVIGENLYYYEGDVEDEEEMTIKTTSPYTCTKQFVVIKEQTGQNGD